MSQKELPYIKSDSLINSFEQHLDDEFNERILFSAPFGAGKSTFLKNFFDKNDRYIVLKLYPVNYSVAPNQDVFEIIKYELLYELLNRFPDDIDLNQDQFSMLLISQMFFLHQMKIDLPMKLLGKASSLIPGATLANETIIDSIINTANLFKDYKKEINKNEFDLLNEHIKAVQKQKGHIYEADEITQLIISLMDRVKTKKIEENPNIQTVLLIDDLDRLDPEHVFRLFNVFSSHYDDVTESNKFYFDKVIFVCDVKNIREMFSHRYGFNVEFTGYIDKFYSTEVFNFDLKRYLKESLPGLFNESTYNPYRNFKQNDIGESLVKRYNLTSGPFKDVVIYILKDMIDFNIIRVRNFKRVKEFSLPNNKIETKFGNVNSVFYPVIVLLVNLEKFFVHHVDLEVALKSLFENYSSNYAIVERENRDQSDHIAENIIHYSLPLILDEQDVFANNYDTEKVNSFEFVNEKQKSIFIIYKMFRDFEYSTFWPKYLKCTFQNDHIEGFASSPAVLRANPYWFLFNAYKILKSRNYF